MAYNPSVVTGVAIGALTNPTYTFTADAVAPYPNGRQFLVTSVGGTQTNVSAHSIDNPFTLAMFRPVNVKTRQGVDPATGIAKVIGENTHKWILRKGVQTGAFDPRGLMIGRFEVKVPCGAESSDPNNVAAFWSAWAGFCYSQAQACLDQVKTGAM